MKTLDQIQRAHNPLHPLLSGELPCAFESDTHRDQIAGVLAALCWVLGCPRGEQTQANLDSVEQYLARKGLVMSKAPAVTIDIDLAAKAAAESMATGGSITNVLKLDAISSNTLLGAIQLALRHPAIDAIREFVGVDLTVDGSHLSDICDAVETLANICRRARASQPTGGDQ